LVDFYLNPPTTGSIYLTPVVLGVLLAPVLSVLESLIVAASTQDILDYTASLEAGDSIFLTVHCLAPLGRTGVVVVYTTDFTVDRLGHG